MQISEIEHFRNELQKSFDQLVKSIGKVPIGKKRQFPFGWRKAKKGRTVWRILEELIVQNLEKYHTQWGLSEVVPSESEIAVTDCVCQLQSSPTKLFVNIKSAVSGGRIQKDDISKGEKLLEFYEEAVNKHLFIATFYIKFNDDMTISIERCVVFPVVWIPDVYINPSNNGNLQSSKYKDMSFAEKRTNAEFLKILRQEINIAKGKRQKRT